MGDIPKASVLYIHASPGITPECSYLCGECVFLRGNDCALLVREDCLVSLERGGCGLFIDGVPDDEGSIYPFLTKEQVGYVENENGFGCRRCKEFRPSSLDCDDVDKKSLGDDPGMILPGACCDNWKPDPRRGQMDDDRLARELAPDMETAARKMALR